MIRRSAEFRSLTRAGIEIPIRFFFPARNGEHESEYHHDHAAPHKVDERFHGNIECDDLAQRWRRMIFVVYRNNGFGILRVVAIRFWLNEINGCVRVRNGNGDLLGTVASAERAICSYRILFPVRSSHEKYRTDLDIRNFALEHLRFLLRAEVEIDELDLISAQRIIRRHSFFDLKLGYSAIRSYPLRRNIYIFHNKITDAGIKNGRLALVEVAPEYDGTNHEFFIPLCHLNIVLVFLPVNFIGFNLLFA